ncbi:MAG: C1 family peptidase [Paludibacteraceae bacterium]|nr:C1 family peptidase [Paludibacteraceae bacterium]
MIKRLFITTFLFGLNLAISAQNLTPELLNALRASYQDSPTDRAVRNAMGSNDPRTLALNQDNQNSVDTHFTYEVPQKGITDQMHSGRCWLFCGLNVLRADVQKRIDIAKLEFSQNYLFFYDQLEKSNLFLQSIIDTRDLPMDDRTVDYLFHNPINDGGSFTGVADLVNKYGVVPAEVMHETWSANNTARIREILSTKLREFGLALRETSHTDLQQMKQEQMKEIYRILCLAFGVPPTEFTWSHYNSDDQLVSTEHYTPLSFAQKYLRSEMVNDYIMFMNDPSREYYKVYDIDLDRHTYEGHNWRYINVPIEDMQEAAIASLKDGVAMYIGCDVNKERDPKRGLLDMNNYDYASLLGVEFNMDKRQRILTMASGSSHAMALMAVDIQNGNPVKWEVENSWGKDNGFNGHLIMTDEWFHNYMFRLVVESKYVPAKLRALLKQEPVVLPMWDPMFQAEE